MQFAESTQDVFLARKAYLKAVLQNEMDVCSNGQHARH